MFAGDAGGVGMQILKQVLSIVVTAGGVTALASGCGGDSGGNPADTGLPPTKLLSDVTPDEATRACERVQSSMQRYFNEDTMIDAICTMGAAANSESASACSSFREGCIEEMSQPGSELMMAFDFDSISLDCEMPQLAQCGDATVGDLETCMGDTFDLLDALLHRFDCSDAGTITEADLEFDFEPPQSCNVVTCEGAQGPFG
jgi:hypothetical protein